MPHRIAELLALSWRQDPRKLLVAALLMAGNALAAPLGALSLKHLTDAALDGRGRQAALYGVLVALCALGALTFAHFAHIAYFEISELNVLDMDDRLIDLANGTPFLEHQEDPAFADEFVVLRQEMQRVGEGLQAALAGLSLAVSMVLTAVLLAFASPALLALPLLAVPSLWAARRAQARLDAARRRSAPATRSADHLLRLATTAATAKELRTLRLRGEIRARHRRSWASADRILARAQLGAGLEQTAGQLVFALGYAAGLYVTIRTVIGGSASVGDAVLAVVLAAQVNQQVAEAVTLFQQLQRTARAFSRLRRVRRMSDRTGPVAPPGDPAPAVLRTGVEFRNVAFRYAGTDRFAIADVNLRLPAGGTVAIVGENGAGKTTLVKLLCRMYDPSAGRILVDGRDLRDIDPARWRSRIAAGFQDFARFEFTAQETVGVGDLPRLAEADAVRGALRRARADAVLRALPDGLATRLGKSHPDGVELSGGQWQQLALGRTMMRSAPLLLVLDEPTAALDAAAEHRLFEEYAAGAARAARRTGAITVLISHRFSAVRMADLIVVVADGAVREAGTHDELIAAGGLYADLYGIQAAAYR